MRATASKTASPTSFYINQNLYDFWTIARKKRWLRMAFWIDAVRVDQDDAVERSHQVAHMGYVYAHAMGVAVWLGRTMTRYRRTANATELDSW